MLEQINILAQQAGAARESGLSAQEVGAIVAAVISAMGLGGWAGKKIQERSMEIKPSPLPVEVRKALATHHDVQEMTKELERRITIIERGQTEERRLSVESQAQTHRRIDKVSEGLAAMRGEMSQLNANLSRLLDHKINTSRS